VRLALDATSLLGPRTGVGTFTAQVLDQLCSDLSSVGLAEIIAFGVSWNGRHQLGEHVPPGVTVIRRPMAARPMREMWRRADFPPIEWWTGAVDVVHGPNFVVPPSRRAARVVTVHDLTCVRFPEMCTRDALQYPALLRREIRTGAWVHAVSRFVADEIIERFDVAAERIRVVPNGAPAPVDQETLDRLAPLGHRLGGGDRFILALGTLEPRKDLPTLVAAFDRLATEDPALRLVVAGPDGWGAAAVTAAIARAHHGDRIIRLGWVSTADRDALLAGATVFAYPSRYEGFGLPPLEAAAHRCPVVATTVGALPEVLGDAAEWAPPGQADALADSLARVTGDPGRADQLVARGLERLGHYSWRRTATELAQLYRDAAHG